MNLRILVYLNPSNIDKITHKFRLQQDSGFIFVKQTILALNEIENWHFYVLVPTQNLEDCWTDAPENVTLMPYPYVNDALNSRFHFDTNALLKLFNNYNHDIDLIWTMLPEQASALKGFANKRREEIPVFSYINWMDYKETKGYEPSYLLRMLDGIVNSDAVGIQSNHMLNYMQEKLLRDFSSLIDYSKIKVISPKTHASNHPESLGNKIGFPHRISTESYFTEMFDIISPLLKYKLWVTNLNNVPVKSTSKLHVKTYEDHDAYRRELSRIRFGISYHIGYSMWSMSVLDMMMVGKVVLVPRANAFTEMFDEDYPFFFSDEAEFKSKFCYLQDCPDSVLLKWGARNKTIAEERFTWSIQARELSVLFLSLLAKKSTSKTKSVLDVIKEFECITKGDIINKNITAFGRQCSRAWNKTRLELMREYGIEDDMKSEHTLFYVAGYDLGKGVIRRPTKKITAYELRRKGI